MGHYDSCRDAHEEVERERRGKRMREWVAKLSDKELGQLRDDLDDLMELRDSLMGNYSVVTKLHARLASIRKVLGI